MLTFTTITYKLDERFKLEFTNDWEGKYYHLQIINGDLTPLCYIPPASSGSVLCISGIPTGHSSSRIYELLVKNTYWIGKIYLLDAPKWLMNKIEEVKACNEDFGLSFAIEKHNANNIHNITPNLLKYIPEDNAVLFLDGEKISLIDYDNYYDMFSGYRDIEFEGKIIKGMPYHPQIYGIHTIGDRVSVHKHEHGIDDYTNFTLNILKGKKLTIFLPHGTQSELQKANEVGKYLWENFGIKPDVFVLHCFLTKIVYGTVGYLCDKKKYMLSIKNKCFMDDIYCKDTSKLSRLNKDYDKEFIYYELDTLNGEFAEYINKIITTNSTGILKPEDSNERLQIIDVKEIFEECGEIVKNNP